MPDPRSSIAKLWQSLKTLIVRTGQDSAEDRVFGLAAEVAFFGLLSLPPTLLAILGSVGYLAEALGPDITMNIRDQVLATAGAMLTTQTVTDVIAPLVDTLLEDGRADVISVGIVLTLLSASRVTTAMMRSVRLAYDVQETRPILVRRLLALALTVGGIVVAILGLPLLVAGPRLGQTLATALGLPDVVDSVWRVLYWPVVALAGVGMLTTFYHAALPWNTPFKRDLPGAVLAALLLMAGGAGLRLYISTTIEGTAAYGPLAAPLVILLWIYVTALVTLLGAELNGEIEKLWPSRRDAPSANRLVEEVGEIT